MRLVACHIENFGRLQGQDFDFSKNPTVVFAPNGWGKSTLAAFLKSMFYGLPDSRVKHAEGNARLKYKPWQGGVFGGWLRFEKDGKEYLVRRIFSDGAKGDDCKIYDGKTNLISQDFPPYKDGLGRALFGVDEEGYDRLVYFPQGSVESKLDGGLQAALLRSRERLEGGEDVDRAVERIENAERELRAKRRPAKGRLDILDEEIARLEEDCYQAKKSAESWAQTEKELLEIEEKLAAKSHASVGSTWQAERAARVALVEERRARLVGIEKSEEEGKKKRTGLTAGICVALLLAVLGMIFLFLPALPTPFGVAFTLLGWGGVIACLLLMSRSSKKDESGYQEAKRKLEEAEQALLTESPWETDAWDTERERLQRERERRLLEGQPHRLQAQTLSDKQRALAEKRAQKEELERKAWCLAAAKELLVRAKHQSASGCIRRLEERCQALFEQFYPQKGVVLTAEGEIRLDEAGALREGGYYSAGMRAALGICIRLALLERLFEGEKIPLILDDPFVDMDEGNLRLAKQFLLGLHREYQVVYLTCHESRLPVTK